MRREVPPTGFHTSVPNKQVVLPFIVARAPGERGSRKPGRAKYMRFWRSITCSTKRTPPALLEHLKQLRDTQKNNDKRGFLTFLFEDL